MTKKLPVPSYEELFKLSNIDNMSLADLAQHYNTTPKTIKAWKRQLNIPKKSREQKVDCLKNTMKRKYGAEYASQVPSIRKKQKETCLKRYGSESALSNKAIYKKTWDTNCSKYGPNGPLGNVSCRDKAKLTCLKKYGAKSYAASDVGRKQIEETCLKRNGYTNPFRSKDLQKKWVEDREKRTGYKYPLQNPETVKKQRQVCMDRYGVDNYFKSEEFKKKTKEHWNSIANISNPAQLHYSDFTKQILFNRNKFIDFIKSQENKNPKNLSDKLEVDILTIHKYAKKYECEELFEYNVSSYENEIKDLFPGIFEHNRSVIKPYEIDLYSKEHKIGIEFNGNYWHCDAYKSKEYHKNKSDIASSNGVFLYHIFEYEWTDVSKREIIISQINSLLGNSTKVFARKCIIKEVDTESSRIFLDKNHLQGRDNSSIKLGLYYKDELVSLMTFGKPRFNSKYEYELIRFCNKKGFTVVGGASKLFKYFIKVYRPKSIISYSNISKTTGNMYKILGFTQKSISKPNYVWIKRFDVLTRYQCQKSKLIKLGYDPNKSEDTIMRERGFNKLYDCGNILWELIL